MQRRSFAPAPALRSYIEGYWTLDGSAYVPQTVTLLPDGAVHLVLNLGEPILSLSAADQLQNERLVLVGTTLRPERQLLQGVVRLCGVSFHPGGFTHFFNGSLLSGLTNRFEYIGLKGFPDIAALNTSFQQSLDRYFLARLTAPRNALHDLARFVQSQPEGISSRVLARRYALTERTLEREFQKQLGITPKQFINLSRFQVALRRVQSALPTETLTQIAYDCGYCDQAHMTNEFQRFAGAPPSAYRSSEKSKP